MTVDHLAEASERSREARRRHVKSLIAGAWEKGGHPTRFPLPWDVVGSTVLRQVPVSREYVRARMVEMGAEGLLELSTVGKLLHVMPTCRLAEYSPERVGVDGAPEFRWVSDRWRLEQYAVGWQRAKVAGVAVPEPTSALRREAHRYRLVPKMNGVPVVCFAERFSRRLEDLDDWVSVAEGFGVTSATGRYVDAVDILLKRGYIEKGPSIRRHGGYGWNYRSLRPYRVLRPYRPGYKEKPWWEAVEESDRRPPRRVPGV